MAHFWLHQHTHKIIKQIFTEKQTNQLHLSSFPILNHTKMLQDNLGYFHHELVKHKIEREKYAEICRQICCLVRLLESFGCSLCWRLAKTIKIHQLNLQKRGQLRRITFQQHHISRLRTRSSTNQRTQNSKQSINPLKRHNDKFDAKRPHLINGPSKGQQILRINRNLRTASHPRELSLIQQIQLHLPNLTPHWYSCFLSGVPKHR